MKKLLFFLVFVFLSSNVEGQPSGINDVLSHVQNSKKKEETPTPTSCLTFNLIITKHFDDELGGGSQIVNAVINDPEGICTDTYSFRLEVTDHCNGFYDNYTFRDWERRLVLSFNGNQIESTEYSSEDISYIFQFTDEDINIPSNVGFPNVLNFNIEMDVIVTAFGLPFPASDDFQIPFSYVGLNDNNVWTISYFGNGTNIEYPVIVPGACDLSYGKACCQTKVIISSRVDKVRFITQESSNIYQVNTSFSTTAEFLGQSFSITTDYNETLEDISGITNINLDRRERRIILDPSTTTADCVALVPITYLRNYITKTYSPRCGNYDELINETEVWIPDELVLEPSCWYDLSAGSSCPPLAPPQINKEFDGNLLAQNNCLGFIEVLNYNYETHPSNTILWEGPNGYISNDYSIYNLDLGVYHYTISNECCDILEGEVSLCDNMQISQWIKDSESEQWCRTLSCIDPVSLTNSTLEDCETIECVTPDNIEMDSNEEGDCINKFYFKGELLGEMIVDVPGEIFYNEDSKKCQLIKMCSANSEPIIVLEEEPTFVDWDFDDWDKKCTRAILCFDEELNGHTDIKDPVITVEWSDFW